MQTSAKSVILDLLSTLRRNALPVRLLVAAAALFGINENGLRVALARLLAAGLVERDERGLYRLAGKAEAVNRETTSWRSVEQSLRPWGGSWIGAFLPRKSGGTRRDRTGRALAFLGFRELEAGLHVRPDNLAGGVDAARSRLTDLGLDAAALVASLASLDATTEARARSLWDVASLRAGYRRTRLQLERSAERLSRLDPAHAMVESFLLGGQAIRQIVFDPRLPEEMLPGAERRELVARMLDYDKSGRACWAPLMREAGASNLRTPAQLRVVDGDGRLAPPDAAFIAG